MNQKLDNYKQLARKFPTYNVLEYLSKESMDIYKNHKIGIKTELIPIYHKKYGYKMGECTFNIAQWNLLETCFYSIKYSNDFRNIELDQNNYYNLLNETKIISEQLEDVDNFKDDDILKHMICISNMEFDFEILNIKNKFSRLYYIMTIINNNPKYDQTSKVNYIDFKAKFNEITNIDYDKYIKCYMFIVLIALSKNNPNIIEIINSVIFDVSALGFSKDDMLNIIENQSKEYEFYRDYDNWNILKYNPIVHCCKDKEKYIISNISALLISFSEFMYWTIRNFYNEIKSQKFTNYFGHCFEFYLNDFFDEYKINYKKIDEGSDKMPDWKVETTNYIFLIEQKSALYPMDTRNNTSKNRIDKLNKYLKDNIEKAFIQLNNYKIASKKTIIRICLTLEQIYFPETVQEITLPNLPSIKEEYLNWVIPISDFEKLFIILNNDENKFNKIIENKIELEKNHDENGRGFDKLLKSYKNEYISNKINYFDKILFEEVDILKKIE